MEKENYGPHVGREVAVPASMGNGMGLILEDLLLPTLSVLF